MKRYRVGFALEAIDHVARIRPWWTANRPAAPDLFDQELVAAVSKLETSPTIGSRFTHPRTDADFWRVLLPRSRYHVYYIVDEGALVVWILAVWHASRGEGPPL